MLRVCIPIFGSGKYVLLDSGFCANNGITDLKDKYSYVADLIKKCRYWPKLVPGDLIDTCFGDKQVSDVGMIETKTEDNKLFKTFFIKDLD